MNVTYKITIALLIVIIIFLVIEHIFLSKDAIVYEMSKPTPSPPLVIKREFKATLKFTGTKFNISNLSDLDCQETHMAINEGHFGTLGIDVGYVLDGKTLKASESYEVGMSQFAKKDGTRFDPFETKPFELIIYCNGSNALQDEIVAWKLD